MKINSGYNGWEQKIIAREDGKRSTHCPCLSKWLPIIACVVFWMILASVRAQDSPPALVASLSASTTQTEFFLSNASDRTAPTSMRTLATGTRRIVAKERANTDDEAWSQFEAEYRPQSSIGSPIKHQIESAKYGLDCAVFAFRRLSRSIDGAVRFKLDRGRVQRVSADSVPVRRYSSNPLTSVLEDAYVKLDVQMPPNKPYVGVRFVIPLGN
jgi:hypothetical protein